MTLTPKKLFITITLMFLIVNANPTSNLRGRQLALYAGAAIDLGACAHFALLSAG